MSGLLLLVTGSRNLDDAELVLHALAERAQPGARLMHGGHGLTLRRERSGLDPMLYLTPVRSADAQADRAWRREIAQTVAVGPVTVVPADWAAPCQDTCRANHRKISAGRSYCPAAGVFRNQVMVERAALAAARGWTVQVLAFPRGGSAGTRDCMRRAEAAGLEVVAL
jgi:hypothetical protein